MSAVDAPPETLPLFHQPIELDLPRSARSRAPARPLNDLNTFSVASRAATSSSSVSAINATSSASASVRSTKSGRQQSQRAQSRDKKVQAKKQGPSKQTITAQLLPPPQQKQQQSQSTLFNHNFSSFINPPSATPTDLTHITNTSLLPTSSQKDSNTLHTNNSSLTDVIPETSERTYAPLVTPPSESAGEYLRFPSSQKRPTPRLTQQSSLQPPPTATTSATTTPAAVLDSLPPSSLVPAPSFESTTTSVSTVPISTQPIAAGQGLADDPYASATDGTEDDPDLESKIHQNQVQLRRQRQLQSNKTIIISDDSSDEDFHPSKKTTRSKRLVKPRQASQRKKRQVEIHTSEEDNPPTSLDETTVVRKQLTRRQSPRTEKAIKVRRLMSPPANERNAKPQLNSTHAQGSVKQPAFGRIHFGEYHIEPWYYSPYPLYGLIPCLYVCERCFKYYETLGSFSAHAISCKSFVLPGRLAYRKDSTSIWEIDSLTSPGAKLFAQNLCLFGTMFLDTKSIYGDVSSFLFYVLTADESQNRSTTIGFFSKEKLNFDAYNLACIITFPPWQRKGYGTLMMEFSYELSIRQGHCGTPERPLSTLGQRGYLQFWAFCILRLLRQEMEKFKPHFRPYSEKAAKSKANPRKEHSSDMDGPRLTLRYISSCTGIRTDDIALVIRELGLLQSKFIRCDPQRVERFDGLLAHGPLNGFSSQSAEFELDSPNADGESARLVSELLGDDVQIDLLEHQPNFDSKCAAIFVSQRELYGLLEQWRVPEKPMIAQSCIFP